MITELSLDRANPLPLYFQIKNQMIERIRSGQFDTSVRIPSEMEIAKTNGISPMTVRQAYKEMVDEGFLYRIQGKGTFVNKQLPGEDKPDLPSEELEAKTTEVAVICNTFREAFMFCAQLQMGIEEAADEYNINIHMLASKGRPIYSEKNQVLRSLLNDMRLDGAIIIGPINDSDLALLKSLSVATVIVDHDNQDEHQTRIMAEDEQFVQAAIKTIATKKHERVGLLCGPKSDRKNVIRRGDRLEAGLKKCAKQNGLTIPRDAIQHCDVTDPDSMYDIVNSLLDIKNRPTAIISDGDGLTRRLIECIQKRGLHIPDDVEVFAYADTDACMYPFAHKPLFEMGKMAVDCMRRQIARTPIKGRYFEIPVTFND